MALNFIALSSLHPKPKPPPGPPFLSPKPPPPPPPHHHHLFKLHSSVVSSSGTAAQPEGNQDRGVTEEDPPTYSGSSSARTQLDLLEQLTSTKPTADGSEGRGSSGKLTIRNQLAQLVGNREDDFSLPLALGKDLMKKASIAKLLTISQKRNIRRQAYLNEVSKRNDTAFFASIGAFVIFPPLIILGIAISTGYVQLFP